MPRVGQIDERNRRGVIETAPVVLGTPPIVRVSTLGAFDQFPTDERDAIQMAVLVSVDAGATWRTVSRARTWGAVSEVPWVLVDLSSFGFPALALVKAALTIPGGTNRRIGLDLEAGADVREDTPPVRP